MAWQGKTCPLERRVRDALISAGIDFERADDKPEGLDFYLKEYGIFVEVKRFHTPRISDQMSRAPNVIALQGDDAVNFFVTHLSRQPHPARQATEDTQP